VPINCTRCRLDIDRPFCHWCRHPTSVTTISNAVTHTPQPSAIASAAGCLSKKAMDDSSQIGSDNLKSATSMASCLLTSRATSQPEDQQYAHRADTSMPPALDQGLRKRDLSADSRPPRSMSRPISSPPRHVWHERTSSSTGLEGQPPEKRPRLEYGQAHSDLPNRTEQHRVVPHNVCTATCFLRPRSNPDGGESRISICGYADYFFLDLQIAKTHRDKSCHSTFREHISTAVAAVPLHELH
jgi:hypothetical protein